MKKIRIWAIIITLSIGFLYSQNKLIQITEVTVFNDHVEGSPVKILQISDLHNQTFGQDQLHLVEKIHEIQPDFIVITGDFVDSKRYTPLNSLSILDKLSGEYPVYYVTGNHEAWSGEFETFENQLRSYGVVVLRNENILFKKGDLSINILGIDDPAFNTNKSIDVLVDESQMNILLSHRPQNINYYSQIGIDLMLSGHAHGGQIRVPFIGGLVSPDQGFFPELTEGEHAFSELTLIISRGLGNSIFSQRLFNRPELVVITIE